MALVVLRIVEQRLQAVLLEVLNQGRTVTEVAARYGVARQTLHRWLGRYQTDGSTGWRTGRIAPSRIRIRCRSRSRLRWWRCGGSTPIGGRDAWRGTRAARHRRESSVGVGDLPVSTPPWSGAGKETATSPGGLQAVAAGTTHGAVAARCGRRDRSQGWPVCTCTPTGPSSKPSAETLPMFNFPGGPKWRKPHPGISKMGPGYWRE